MYQQLVAPNLGQTSKAGLCLQFARTAFKASAVEASAWKGWLNAKHKHEDRNLPNVCVPVWFQHFGSYGSPAIYDNWGHVAIHVPGMGFLSSPITFVGPGQQWFNSIEELVNAMNRIVPGSKTAYVGWSEDISNVRVAKENDEVIELQPPVFNAEYYLSQNPDVKKAGLKAEQHWLDNGIKEGRNSAPNFHVREYLENYIDLKNSYGTNFFQAIEHYYKYGVNEGRYGTKAAFDASQESKKLRENIALLENQLAETDKALKEALNKPPVVVEVEPKPPIEPKVDPLVGKLVDFLKKLFKKG